MPLVVLAAKPLLTVSQILANCRFNLPGECVLFRELRDYHRALEDGLATTTESDTPGATNVSLSSRVSAPRPLRLQWLRWLRIGL